MADKSLPQLNSLPSALLNTDLFHVARAAVDYKLNYSALLTSLNADLVPSGVISGLTINYIPVATAADAIGDSYLSQDVDGVLIEDGKFFSNEDNLSRIELGSAGNLLISTDGGSMAEGYLDLRPSQARIANQFGKYETITAAATVEHTTLIELTAPSVTKNGSEISTEAYADAVVTAARIGSAINGAASATPNDTDLVISVESSVAKKNTWTQVKAFLKTYFDTVYQAILTAANFGDFIVALTGKTTPVDADSIVISDSAAGDDAKKVSLTNFKAFLKTYFDTIYIPRGQSGTIVFTHTALTFLDSTSYYFANMASLAGTSSSSLRKKPLGITGFAYKFVIKVVCNTAAGTAEDCVLTFRDVTAGTSVVLKTNLHFDANNEYVVTPASPFAIVDINSCECQIDIPLMATNPQGAYLQVTVIMSN